MASIAFDTSASLSVSPSSTNTASMTISATAHRYLYVVTGDNVTSVSFAGAALSVIKSHTLTGNGGYNYVPNTTVWGLADPASGTGTLSVTAGASGANPTATEAVVAVSYTGIDNSGFEASNTNQTNGGPQSSITDSLNTVTANAWMATFVRQMPNSGTAADNTAGASTTLRVSKAFSNFYGAFTASVLDGNTAEATPAQYSLVTNNANTGWFNTVSLSLKPYLSYTLTGPASGNVNSASTNFTVTPDAAITGSITITPSGGGLSTPITLNFSNSASPQTFTITPTNGGTVTLTPTNAVGIHDPSYLTYTANPVVPSAPGIGTALPANASAQVPFTPSANNGGATITGYTATSTPGSFTATGTTSPLTVTGLANGTAYTFTVHATNSAGNSAESSASNSVTPYVATTAYTITGPIAGNVRSASTNFTITPNAIFDGTITVTFGGVGSTGLSPQTFTFNHSSAAQTFTITPTASGLITITGTNSGTLTNPAPLGYDALPVVPLAPSIGYVAPDINSLRVSVIAPSNNGGSTILYYTITCSNGTVMTLTAPGEAKFTNLSTSQTYTFYASATNAIGVSANSTTTVATAPLDQAARYFNSGPKFGITNGVGNQLSF